MIDTFIYDNLFHILSGVLVFIFSVQIAKSTKNISGLEMLQKLNNPQIFRVIGAVWALYGILTFAVPLYF